MATVSRWTSFLRAFFAVLLSGSAASAAGTDESETWSAAMSADTAEAYYHYLSLFPAGDYVDDAVAALARLGVIGAPRKIAPVPPAAGGTTRVGDGGNGDAGVY
ncbi:MAG: hypothetical protein WAS26_08310 [Paracoccaceae bacterium]|jgi:hypothetical protein